MRATSAISGPGPEGTSVTSPSAARAAASTAWRSRAGDQQGALRQPGRNIVHGKGFWLAIRCAIRTEALEIDLIVPCIEQYRHGPARLKGEKGAAKAAKVVTPTAGRERARARPWQPQDRCERR